MADNIHNLIRPNADVLRAHLEHLFRRAREEYDGGRCEVAWSDKNYKPNHAETYPITSVGLDQATDAAVKYNLAGSNVYFGANPRKPNTPPFGRCNGSDVEIAYHQFVDADSSTAADNLLRAPLMYTWAVVTGRHPHQRPHCYWALEHAVLNMDAWTDQQRSLAIYFGSDPVINRAQIMRAGGSVNYPSPKKLTLGYRVEVTTLRTLYDGEERSPVSSEALFRFYPWNASSQRPSNWYDPETGEISDKITEEQIAIENARVRSYNIPIDKIDPEHCVQQIKAGISLHLNTRDLINHLIATGHRDWLIEDYVTRLLAPVSDGGTLALIPNLIRTWRQKIHIPDPVEEDFVTGAATTGSALLKPVGLLDPKDRQPRQFIVPRRLMRGHVTMTAAGPAVGKTTLAVEEAVSLASGIDFLGFGITQKYRVAIINNEESRDELERRIEATCKHFKVPPAEIADTLFLYSGVDAEKIIVATADRNGKVVPTVYVARLREEILDLKLDVVVLDPFVQIHYVEESSNEQISRVLVQVRSMGIGDEHRAAIHVVHHTRKAPPGSSTQAGDMQAARGASSMGGEAHLFFTMTEMSDADGEKLNILENDRVNFIRLDDAKPKLGPAGSVRWFRRYGVMMPYGLVGEEVGVLLPCDMDAIKQEISSYKATELLTEIDRAWQAGNPYSEGHQGKDRYVLPMMQRLGGMTKQAAKTLLGNWLENGMVATKTRDTHKNLKGLKVEKWPG